MPAPVTSNALLVSDALLATLKAANGPNIWVQVPENTLPPYTVIAGFVSAPIGGKTSTAELHVVDIIDWAQGNSRAPLHSRMAATKAALDKVLISFAGLADLKPEWLPGAADELHEDGVTWSGTQRFRILGQLAG